MRTAPADVANLHHWFTLLGAFHVSRSPNMVRHPCKKEPRRETSLDTYPCEQQDPVCSSMLSGLLLHLLAGQAPVAEAIERPPK